jgi:hypothetical protein
VGSGLRPRDAPALTMELGSPVSDVSLYHALFKSINFFLNIIIQISVTDFCIVTLASSDNAVHFKLVRSSILCHHLKNSGKLHLVLLRRIFSQI